MNFLFFAFFFYTTSYDIIHTYNKYLVVINIICVSFLLTFLVCVLYKVSCKTSKKCLYWIDSMISSFQNSSIIKNNVCPPQINKRYLVDRDNVYLCCKVDIDTLMNSGTGMVTKYKKMYVTERYIISSTRISKLKCINIKFCIHMKFELSLHIQFQYDQ